MNISIYAVEFITLYRLNSWDVAGAAREMGDLQLFIPRLESNTVT